MRVLLVGAGAVGQSYGRHLQLGGCRVAFLVRERHEAALRRGVTMYPLERRDRRAPVRFDGFDVLTSPEAVGRGRFDQVWLCMSSTALKGPWFDALVPHLGGAAVLTLQPGLEDRAWVAERVGAERLLSGVITVIAYHAPLAGERGEPGVAYWFPPLSPFPVSGPAHLVQATLDALRLGGVEAVETEDTAAITAVGSATMNTYMVALEAAGWSLAALREGPLLPLGARAVRQAQSVAAAVAGCRVGAARALGWPRVARLALALAPRLVPFDLEVYLRAHFTKVGDQTRAGTRAFIQQGHSRGLPVDAIETLAVALDQAS